MPEMIILGDNVEGEVTNAVLTLKIDLSKRGQRSKSGKTIRVASTEGNKGIPGTDVILGLNAYVSA